MNKDEMIKNDRRKIMDLLYKLKKGELCTPNCYGCCGDNELNFAYCPDVTDNFEKELANLGCRKVADDEIVLKMSEYEELKTNIEDLQVKLGAVMLCIKNTHEIDISDLLRKQKQATAREILQYIHNKKLSKAISEKYGIDEED